MATELTGEPPAWGAGETTPRRRTRWARLRLIGGYLLLGVVMLLSGMWYRYTHRPQPPPVRMTLFQGITYIRDVRRSPRSLIIHVVLVQMDAPGISFLVTPPDARKGSPLRARTTTRFVREFGVQVAINGDFYYPGNPNAPFGRFLREGDPAVVEGFAASRGTVYSRGSVRPTLYLTWDNRAGFNRSPGPIYNAISGDALFLERGVYHPFNKSYHKTLYPRAVLAVDQAGKRLILIVVDGRQPHYSEGVTLAELAEITREYGGYTALNLDGGGSVALVVEGPSGSPVMLNSQFDLRMPFWERPVGNHLGIFARKLPRTGLPAP